MKKIIKAFEEVNRYMEEDYVPETENDEAISQLVKFFIKKELEWMKK